MATVLFVCLHNAGRSQMSQALFERAAAAAASATSWQSSTILQQPEHVAVGVGDGGH